MKMSLPIGMRTEEIQHQLCQLQLLNGFQSDPNKPGVEKLVGCLVQASWLFKPAPKLTAADLSDPGVAGPGQLFVVKGWNRSICAVGILYACYQQPELLQEGFPPPSNNDQSVSSILDQPLAFQIDWLVLSPERSCQSQCGSNLEKINHRDCSKQNH